jgi:hypothetical protein
MTTVAARRIACRVFASRPPRLRLRACARSLNLRHVIEVEEVVVLAALLVERVRLVHAD